MSATFDAILFDLDGVLIDSRTPIARCINHALRALGFPEQDERSLSRYIGPPLHDAFAELLESVGADPARAWEAVGLYRERYEWACIAETLVVPGIEDVLKTLAEHQRLAVATSKPVEYAVRILDALGLTRWFGSVAGPSMDTPSEPKAVTAARALDALQNPKRAAIVGDRLHDVAAGKANGLFTIGVLWGIGDRAELEAAGADVVVAEPRELCSLASRAAPRS